jgi:hypothetical protein
VARGREKDRVVDREAVDAAARGSTTLTANGANGANGADGANGANGSTFADAAATARATAAGDGRGTTSP